MLLNAGNVCRGGAAALAVALTLLAHGCKPTLEEGKYGCDDGQCPDHWRCDLETHLCYSKVQLTSDGSGTSGGHGHHADDGGTDAGVEPDSGVSNAGTGSGSTGSAGRGGSGGAGAGSSGSGGGVSGAAGHGGAGGAGGASGAGGSAGAGGASGEPYAACEAGTSCAAAGGSCVLAPDDGASHGVCAPSCGSDAECPANAGQSSVCLAGLGKCLPGCAAAADCPEGLACHDLAVAMMQTRAVCFEVTSPELLGTAACTPGDMSSCGRGATCAFTPNPAGGVCSFRCDTQACPAGGRCVEIFSGVHQCLKPCTGSGSGGGQCGALTCAVLGGMQLCVPAAWAGSSLPLAPPMMM